MKTNYQNASMLDMIFEHRNKTYGAYALRNNYNSRISQSLLIMVSVVTLLCFGKFISDRIKSNPVVTPGHIVELDPIPPVYLGTPQIKIDPPKPPVALGINTIHHTEMQVTTQNNVIDSVPTNDQLHDAESGLTTNTTTNTIGVTDGQGTEQTFTVAQPTPPIATPVLTWADVMPEFPGGEKKMMDFLRNKTSFPDIENDLGLQGKALVRFVVNEDGSISDIKVIKTDSPGFGKEAKRVVGIMPKFVPGSQAGKPVKVQFVLPFQFTSSR